MLVSDQLKQSRASKAEEAQAIYTAADTAKRAPTPEEKTKFDALMVEVDALCARIDSQLKIEAVLKDKPAAPPAAAVPQLDNDRKPVIAFPRHSGLRAFTKPFAGRTAEENAYRTGKWLQAALFGNKTAEQWCKENGVFSYGTQQVIYNVQEEGSQSTGGALVPQEMENSIIDLREEYGVIRKYAKIVPMGSDYKTQPRRTGGLTAYPIAESAPFIESTKTWDNVALTAKKWGVLAKYSTELGEDAIINIADDLTQEASYAFAVAEDNAGFNGDGSGAYAGITGVIKKFEANLTFVGAVTVATVTHDLFSEVDGDDIDKLVASLPLYAQRNAKFYVGPVGKALLFDPILRSAGGNTQNDVATGAPPRYMGYPVVQVVAMPNVSTALDDKVMILFGDFAAAVSFGNRRGVTVQILNELYAANGQIGVIASERFDINVHDIGSATVAGPLVALMGSTS